MEDVYFAGLFDGEGYAALLPKKTRIGSDCLQPHISISMTHQGVMQAMQAHFGVGKLRYTPPRQSHHKDQWTWQLNNRQAEVLARRLVDLCIVKRAPLQAIIDHYDSIAVEGISKPSMQGSGNAMAKLSWEHVVSIRALLTEGVSQQKIAAQFGVHQTVVSNIKRKKSYWPIPTAYEDIAA